MRQRAADLASQTWVGAGLGATALATGAVSAVNPVLAVTGLAALVVAVLTVANVTALPAFLAFTMFVESVAPAGALRVGRLAGVLALTVVVLYLLTRGRAGLRANALLVAVAAYGMWTAASLSWAEDGGLVFETSFRYLLVLAYMLAFALLVRSKQHVVVVFATLAFGALVFGLISFAGYASAADDYNSLVRAKGLQGDYNFFALYEVIALPPALVLAARARTARTTVVYYGVVAAIVLSVVASLSRSGLLALASVVAATLILPAGFFFRQRSQKLTYAAALAASGTVVALAGAAPFIERAATIFHERGVSGTRGSGRIDIWRASWRAFEQHPIVGIGAGNFRSHTFDRLLQTPGVTSTAGYRSKGKYVHSMYLGNLTELGIVGFSLFMVVLMLTFRTLVSSVRRARNRGDPDLARFGAALAVALIGIAVSGFFLSIELAKPLWIVIGLALAFEVMTRRLPEPVGSPRLN
jgi:putative inorganic carbon (HCO3(-)) transporter